MRNLLVAAMAGACLIVAVPLALIAALASTPSLGAAAGSTPGEIPADLVPMYVAAGNAYKVNWLLLAAIHQRETAFSTLQAPGVRSGANGCGAAGPMQFGIVGVEPYNMGAPDCGALTGTGAGATWNSYKNARNSVRDAGAAAWRADRPAACSPVPADTGCVYADFDAIAAASMYLHVLGAGSELDYDAWAAAKAYNGGASYADAVLAQARAWSASVDEDLGADDATTTSVPGARARLLANGLAAPPASAPSAVSDAIDAANEISDRPYLERHWPSHIGSPAYDCSSATSHVLWGAHVFGTAPWVSAQLEDFGESGPGRWITVYANAAHAFVIVAGLRFDTARYDRGPNGSETGPRWRLGPRPTSGFVIRHPRGL